MDLQKKQKPSQQRPLKEVLEQHISLVEDHVRFLEIVHKTTAPASDDLESVEMLVQRARVMLADCKSMQRELWTSKNSKQPLGSPSSPDSSAPHGMEPGLMRKRKTRPSGDATEVDSSSSLHSTQNKNGAMPDSKNGAVNGTSITDAAESRSPKKRRATEAPPFPIGEIFSGSAADAPYLGVHALSSTSGSVVSAHSLREAVATKRDNESKSHGREKRAKNQHEVEVEMVPDSPIVEFENIDEAVNARLREKKEKRGRNKRKLSADASSVSEDFSARFIDDGKGARKRTKKTSGEAEWGDGQTLRHGKRSRLRGEMDDEAEQRMAKRRRSSR